MPNTPKNMSPSEWTRRRDNTHISVLKKLYPEIRARAFAVQGVEKIDALNRIRETIAQITENGNGLSWDAARDKIAAELADADESWRRQHAETVLRTNAFMAAGAARWQEQQELKEFMPYLMYKSMTDDKVRDTHAELDGVILPVDDPFWTGHTPPWDFNCRCMTIALTREAAREQVEKGAGKMWGKGASQDFLAAHRGQDSIRPFQFRPGAMELDIRAIAAARGRTQEQIEDFMEQMEEPQIENRRGSPGETMNVRDWLWRPVSDDIGAHAVRDGDRHEIAIMIDSATGKILGEQHGDKNSAGIPKVSHDGKPLTLAHNHPSGNPTPSPNDLYVAIAFKLRQIEAHGPERKSITRMIDKSENMKEELIDFIYRFDGVRSQGELDEVHKSWKNWRMKAREDGRIKYTEENTHD